MKRFARGILVLFLTAIMGALIWDAFTSDFSALYNFNNLTKERIVEDAQRYSLDRAEGSALCLYVVECNNNRANLVETNDLEAWDIEETKELVWSRKFDGVCTGLVANIALKAQTNSLTYDRRTAYWSFGMDRFLPKATRVGGGAIGNVKPICRDENAIVKSTKHEPK